MDSKLLEMLVCPVTKGSLVYKRRVEGHADGETESQIEELWCRASRLAYPVKDGVPVMLEAQARPLTDEEYAELKI